MHIFLKYIFNVTNLPVAALHEVDSPPLLFLCPGGSSCRHRGSSLSSSPQRELLLHPTPHLPSHLHPHPLRRQMTELESTETKMALDVLLLGHCNIFTLRHEFFY